MQVIYADVYFIVNFSMDFLALFIACKIRKIPLRLWRTAFAAAVGSLYAVISLTFNGAENILTFLLAAAIPFLMCYIAYGGGRAKYYLINVASFWIISFVMGGMMTAIYYFVGKLLSSREIYINGTTYTLYSDIPFWIFIAAAFACALFTVIWNRLAAKKSGVHEASFFMEDGAVSINEVAMCDSGNLLREPLSGLPVIILSNELMEKVAPGIETLKEGLNYRKIRIIPYNTLSGSGILYGYIPDCVKINNDIKKACLCSGKDIGKTFDGYNVIIPTSLL